MEFSPSCTIILYQKESRRLVLVRLGCRRGLTVTRQMGFRRDDHEIKQEK